jgi:hypothetical protein
MYIISYRDKKIKYEGDLYPRFEAMIKIESYQTKLVFDCFNDSCQSETLIIFIDQFNSWCF